MAEREPVSLDALNGLLKERQRYEEWLAALGELQVKVPGPSYQTWLKNTSIATLDEKAAVIAVPTAVTGFYGQNVPYPGYGQLWGFWLSTVVTLIASGLLYVVFRRKGWL